MRAGVYAWRGVKETEMDILLRDGLRVGAVGKAGESGRGWVSATLRPSGVPGMVCAETKRQKAASREEARELTLVTARLLWGDAEVSNSSVLTS